MTKINFDDVPENDFSPLPEDRYKLKCTDAELGVSKNGNDKIDCTFEVIDGDKKGRLVWNTFSLVPKAWFELKNFLEAAGEDVSGEFDAEDVVDMIKGSEVNAYLEIRSYQGKKSNQVKTSSWKDVNINLDNQLFG